MVSNENNCIRNLCKEATFDLKSVLPPLLPEESFPLVSSMALDVSGRCNLRCAYCAEYITMPDRPIMSRHVLHQAIDAVFKWSRKDVDVSFHLGSGEPLLQPKAVFETGRRANRFAQSLSRSVALYLTTNGTLLNDEIISWLVKDGWNVKVSIDGGAEIQDRYRVDKEGKGTYRRIEKAVRILARTIPERFSTLSVLCHKTDPQKVFNSIASMGVKNIELVPVAVPPSSSLSLCEDDLTNYRRFIFDYVQRIAKRNYVPMHIGLRKRIQRVMGYGNARISCGAGRTYFAAGPDGMLYPCFRFVGIRNYGLGDLCSGIRPDRVQWFIKEPGRSYEHRLECRKCWAAPLCGGPCFACAELLGLGSPSPDFCQMVRTESQAAIWLVNVLREKNPERLLEFLGVHLEE